MQLPLKNIIFVSGKVQTGFPLSHAFWRKVLQSARKDTVISVKLRCNLRYLVNRYDKGFEHFLKDFFFLSLADIALSDIGQQAFLRG